MIDKQRQTVGLAKAGRPSNKIGVARTPINSVPTLAEAGIDKGQARGDVAKKGQPESNPQTSGINPATFDDLGNRSGWAVIPAPHALLGRQARSHARTLQPVGNHFLHVKEVFPRPIA